MEAGIGLQMAFTYKLFQSCAQLPVFDPERDHMIAIWFKVIDQ